MVVSPLIKWVISNQGQQPLSNPSQTIQVQNEASVKSIKIWRRWKGDIKLSSDSGNKAKVGMSNCLSLDGQRNAFTVCLGFTLL